MDNCITQPTAEEGATGSDGQLWDMIGLQKLPDAHITATTIKAKLSVICVAVAKKLSTCGTIFGLLGMWHNIWALVLRQMWGRARKQSSS